MGINQSTLDKTLTDYAKSTDVTNLQSRVDTEILSSLAPYAKSTDLSALSAKIPIDIANALLPYTKQTDFNAKADALGAQFNDYTKTADLKSLGLSYADGKLVSTAYGKAAIQSQGTNNLQYFPMQEYTDSKGARSVVFSAPDATTNTAVDDGKYARVQLGQGNNLTLTGNITARNDLNVNGSFTGNAITGTDVALKRGQRVWLSGRGDLAHGVAHADVFPGKGLQDGPVVFGYDGGNLVSHHNDGNPIVAMKWNPNDVWTNKRFSVQDGGSNKLWFTQRWEGHPDGTTNESEISNDINDNKALMVVGNKSGGDNLRRVKVWDKMYLPNGGAGMKIGSWNIFEDSNGYLIFAKDGANDGADQPYVKISGDGNIWMSRSIQSGWIADNMRHPSTDYLTMGPWTVRSEGNGDLSFKKSGINQYAIIATGDANFGTTAKGSMKWLAT